MFTLSVNDHTQFTHCAVTGDSITKQWREVLPQVNGTPEVFTTYFGRYAAAVLGVGGAPCFIDAALIVTVVGMPCFMCIVAVDYHCCLLGYE